MIDSDDATGICGSGLVNLLALLLKHDLIGPTGNFSQGGYRWQLPGTAEHLYVEKADVDIIQRAKAAIATGIEILCEAAGITFEDIGQIYVGGAFGWYLDTQSAKAIGLLPPIASEKIHPVGNSALSGAIKALYSEEACKEMHQQIGSIIQIINMSHSENFESLFLKHLYLAPMEVG